VSASPSFGANVEVDAPCEHRVAFDGVEKLVVPIEIAPQTCHRREEGMRRDHQSGRAGPQGGEIVECPYVLGAPCEIQQQNMLAGDGSFDARNEDDAPFRCVRVQGTEIELSIVKRDRERIETERRSSVDELASRVRNVVDGIVSSVRVKFDFERTAHIP
jgi:hypothetical protein